MVCVVACVPKSAVNSSHHRSKNPRRSRQLIQQPADESAGGIVPGEKEAVELIACEIQRILGKYFCLLETHGQDGT